MLVTSKKHLELDRDWSKRYRKLYDEYNQLWRRSQKMLWAITNATAILEPIFGELQPLGTDDEQEFLLFRALSCLANVSFCPADGNLEVHDPHNKVGSVSVTLDEYGKLNGEAQETVDRFLGAVSLTQHRNGKKIAADGLDGNLPES